MDHKDDAENIGHDPLAWIKNDTPEPVEASDADTSEDNKAAKVSGEIILSGSLGMAEIEDMHQSLLKILHAHVDILIQSEGLNRVDAAGAQLLYAFVKDAEAQQIPLSWISVSDDLRLTADSLGLSEGMGF
ncbi:MAG: STAS domain-containing protein [Mariprofundaceae bacterium]|nr:STAS domain-containing protein [Mariprofundaceae bacterium]